jgi:thiol-disulfide isomerase/thioredoxin
MGIGYLGNPVSRSGDFGFPRDGSHVRLEKEVVTMSKPPAVALLVVLVSSGLPHSSPPAVAQESIFVGAASSDSRDNPQQVSQQYRELLAEAIDLLKREQYEDAVKAFKEANDEADGKSAECLLGLAMAFNSMGAHKNAAKEARKAVEVASDSRTQVQSYTQLGLALLNRGDEDDLDEAELAFRTILNLTDGEANAARFNLAHVLIRQERIQEANVLLEAYLDYDPDGPHADDARAIMENPRRATEVFSPDFSFITLDGEYMTSDDLRGNVVLLDFWATWCGPCEVALPTLRKLAEKMEEEPFILISVSNEDEELLKEFVEENEMTWPQVRGQRGYLNGNLFDVSGIPAYFLLDHEGFILYRTTGWSSRKGRMLSSDTSRAIKNAKKAQQ